ncbi:MAG: hypothetical protein QXS89_07265 [Sulfolobales archaeon]
MEVLLTLDRIKLSSLNISIDISRRSTAIDHFETWCAHSLQDEVEKDVATLISIDRSFRGMIIERVLIEASEGSWRKHLDSDPCKFRV